MNLKIYEKKEEVAKEDRVFYLRLVPRDREIILEVANEDGTAVIGGRLLTLSDDGVFHRAIGIFGRFGGLQLDECNRVKLGEDH